MWFSWNHVTTVLVIIHKVMSWIFNTYFFVVKVIIVCIICNISRYLNEVTQQTINNPHPNTKQNITENTHTTPTPHTTHPHTTHPTTKQPTPQSTPHQKQTNNQKPQNPPKYRPTWPPCDQGKHTLIWFVTKWRYPNEKRNNWFHHQLWSAAICDSNMKLMRSTGYHYKSIKCSLCQVFIIFDLIFIHMCILVTRKCVYMHVCEYMYVCIWAYTCTRIHVWHIDLHDFSVIITLLWF